MGRNKLPDVTATRVTASDITPREGRRRTYKGEIVDMVIDTVGGNNDSTSVYAEHDKDECDGHNSPHHSDGPWPVALHRHAER